MENFNHSREENPTTDWENTNEDLRNQLLFGIAEIEQQIEKIQQEKQANLDIMKNSETLNDAHAQGIFEERFAYEMFKLDEMEYNLDTKLNGLKFQLSNLEDSENNN